MKGRIKIDRSGKKIGIVALFKSIFPRCQRSPKQTRSKYALQWPAISNNRGDSIVQRHFTSFLGRRPLDARDPIGEFESRFGRWTRFECKPTRDCSLSLFLSLSLSLSLSLFLAARRVTRGMGRTYRTLPMELFVQSPLMCIFVRRTRPAMLHSSPFTGTRTITQFPLWFDSIFEIVRFPTRCSRLLVWSFFAAKGMGIFSLSLSME